MSPWRRREFDALVPLYVFAMLLVSVSNNLGILWIAVELTTLVSVFLVAFHNRDTSLEAAWKFLVLGSLGLAFALLGTVLLFASGRGLLGEGMEGLNWTRFVALAGQLHPLTLKLGVVFALVGYGTKAGLAPMHTWKPDAYREAPSPAGVLMAVGMLNGALYCLAARPPHRQGRPGSRVLRRPPAGAGPSFRGRGDALHPDPVEPEAPPRLFQRRARRDHGGGPGSRVGGRDLRRPAPHDLPHPRQAAGLLLRRNARAAPRLVGLRPDRPRHPRTDPRGQRPVLPRRGDHDRIATLRPLLQRDDDPQGRLRRAPYGGGRSLPGLPGAPVLRLLLPDRAGSSSESSRPISPGRPTPRASTPAPSRPSSPRPWPWSRPSTSRRASWT